MADVFDRLKAALSDRYAIVREIGSGGMATVYLAEDLRHERKVAVKVLRPDLAAALGPERFHREIKIAAQLHHPHILPLHDSGDADGFLYYVMPFEEGHSLREKLAKEGELPIGDAVRILRDVVDALSHAHGKGVVHRDIKPDNVMLSGRHALVTDFGVAKAVSEATGRQKLTTEGIALGTPAYMAPEQAAADPHIDHRADIYAVGAVACELLTGRPPFSGNTQQEILAAQVTQSPEPLTKYRASVPPELEQLVLKCLEKKAADRWQSAEELVPRLEALATPSGGLTPTDTRPMPATTSRQRWLVPVLLTFAVAVVIAGYLAFRFAQVGGRGTLIGDDVLAEHDLILVVEFENHTNDSLLAATVTDAVRVDLQQSTVIEVLSLQAMYDGLRRMGLEPGRELGDSLARDLTQRANAKAYVTGNVRRLGSSYQLSARVVGAADGSEALTKRVTADDEADLVAAVEELGKQLRRGIGESLRGLQAAPPLAQVTTSSLPALRAYMSAGREEYQGNRQHAITLLHEAVSLDTAFASAWRRLGTLHYNSNRHREAMEAYHRAYTHRERLSERERLEVTANYHGTRGEYAQEEAAHRQLIELDREADHPWVGLADLKLRTRQLSEAESLSLHAIELNPRALEAYWNAVEAQAAQRRFDAADSTLALMARNIPGHPWIADLKNLLLAARRDIPAERAYLDSLRTHGVTSADSIFVRRLTCGLAMAEGRVAAWRRCGSVNVTAALWELRYTGDTSRVDRMVESMRTWEDPPYPVLIAVLAEMGRPQEARQLLAEWEDAVGADDAGYRADVGLAAGAIALAEGDPDSAVSAYLAWNSAPFVSAVYLYNRGLAEAANAHDRAGRPDSAIALYERALENPSIWGVEYESVWLPHAIRRLGELHESLGHRERAIEYYQWFIDMWESADQVLQPQVEAARTALERLVGEGR